MKTVGQTSTRQVTAGDPYTYVQVDRQIGTELLRIKAVYSSVSL